MQDAPGLPRPATPPLRDAVAAWSSRHGRALEGLAFLVDEARKGGTEPAGAAQVGRLAELVGTVADAKRITREDEARLHTLPQVICDTALACTSQILHNTSQPSGHKLAAEALDNIRNGAEAWRQDVLPTLTGRFEEIQGAMERNRAR